MRSVLLLRHAESSWKHPDLRGHDRPLNKRSKRDASQMRRLLKKEKSCPDVIDMRARTPAEAVAKASGYRGDITFDRSLYAAGPQVSIDVLHQLSDEYVRVLIIGHNPCTEQLVEMLTREIHLMPTYSLAHVKLRIGKWIERDYKIKGQVVDTWRPRDLF